MNKDNIILIGMPGVGKSTIGVILAKELGYQFVDSDLLIQQQEQRLLKVIIAQEGVDGFLAIEEAVNASIDSHRCIIATGGSAVYGQKAMEHFKEIGTIVYLHCSYEILEKRLGDLRGRGVVLKEGQNLHDIFEERSILYRQYADLIIEEDDLGIEKTLQLVILQLTTNGEV